MRIDAKIVRRILAAVESAPGPEVIAMPVCDAGDAVQSYHLRLLIEAGYLRARSMGDGKGPIAVGLTLAGQRFLDELRGRPGAARMLGECAQRVVTGVAMA